MYRVYLINFRYFLDRQTFNSLDEAVAAGRRTGFEFSVFKNDQLVGSAQGVALAWRQR
jgi:hypothetical protein